MTTIEGLQMINKSMITVRKIFGVLFMLTLISACSNDDDNNGGSPNDPDPTPSYLVYEEVGPPGTRVFYEYTETDQLELWNSTYTPTTGIEITFSYNDDGNVSAWNYIDSDDSDFAQSYQYDFQGNLIAYSGPTEDVTLSYSGNTVMLSGTIEGDLGATAELELNAAGRVVKFTESNQYTTFGYDTNGNMIRATRFDLQNVQIEEFTLAYDSKPNPFFGQLGSIYLERFVEFFWEFDGIYFTGLEGYSFPFQQNNVISVKRNGNDQITYSIGYDNNNYPTTISEIIDGNNFQYDINYY
jgi:YD repeat-containing protein